MRIALALGVLSPVNDLIVRAWRAHLSSALRFCHKAYLSGGGWSRPEALGRAIRISQSSSLDDCLPPRLKECVEQVRFVERVALVEFQLSFLAQT